MTILEIEMLNSKITKPIVFMAEFNVPENKWIISRGFS